MIAQDFRQYQLQPPTYDEIAAEYRGLGTRLDAAAAAAGWIAVVEDWDRLRRRLETWQALVDIRFRQDTRNADYQQARTYADELGPRLTELAVALKRRLLASPFRGNLEREFGRMGFAIWECDVAAFDPAIQPDLVRQSKLDAEYTELLASGRFDFQGRQLTLSELGRYDEDRDRQVRHAAARLRWDWFAENQTTFDRIYDDMVRLRHGMAEKLGYENFVPLGYKLLHRIDYDRFDVERFRAEVREHVVPLAVELRRRQAAAIGVDKLMAWDEGLHDLAGNPKPQGDHDWMVERAAEMFRALGRELGDFFAAMMESHLLDLMSREGKAGGGFCSGLPLLEMPFIFANFNGTRGDVEVFTHEMGHAFQCYSSRRQRLVDYLWPSYDACEIHSMGLEFLTWPQMELFFGPDAERFRRLHLAGSLLFLPYGVAVDHFQHLVYESPGATADERAAMWQDMERTYLPWRDYGDLKHPRSGRRWQAQMHIFGVPFYYIDYTLALTCAMQLWVRSEKDRSGALSAYVALCRRGGEAPFQDLVRSAGLTTPFAPGCLQEVVGRARATLGVG